MLPPVPLNNGQNNSHRIFTNSSKNNSNQNSIGSQKNQRYSQRDEDEEYDEEKYYTQGFEFDKGMFDYNNSVDNINTSQEKIIVLRPKMSLGGGTQNRESLWSNRSSSSKGRRGQNRYDSSPGEDCIDF